MTIYNIGFLDILHSNDLVAISLILEIIHFPSKVELRQIANESSILSPTEAEAPCAPNYALPLSQVMDHEKLRSKV